MEDIIKEFSYINPSSTQSQSQSQSKQPTFSQLTSSYKASKHLPTEIILLILIHLDHHTFLSATFTCRRWYALAHHYRQYLWRHLAWRDFSFTAARGLWKLEFHQDRDLQYYFPRRNSERIDGYDADDDYKFRELSGTSSQGNDGTRNGSVYKVCQQTRATKVKGTQLTNDLNCTCARPDLTARGEHVDTDTLESKDKEQDWMNLYQQTSNWYKGRARGYCPIILPSLASLQLATQTLSGISSSTSKSIHNSGSCLESGISTPAQRMIRRMLAKRKPLTVVGLQHEGSAQTVLSLTNYSIDSSSCLTNHHATLIRSNPHYRVRPPSGNQINNQQFSTAGSISFDLEQDSDRPNIIVQDPLEHDHVAFAVRSPLAPSTFDGADGNMGANGIDSEQHQQGQPHHNNPEPSASHQAQADLDPANDISCHYSSPLHSFLVTGHMSGCVRLWDMAIKSPEQQCIRKWHTTGHRRALCVGMNSKVVVCGYNDSNLCVWDIHPDLNPTSSSYGTIHVASFLTLPPHQAGAVDTWFYGVEHVSVGDSLVACSTDYTGSILVFSIATGSLVYELSGSYQPTKMCMTDFFLVTGGRRPGSQNMAMRGQPFQHNLQTNQHSPMVRHAHHTEGTEVSEVDDMADMTGEERPPLVESEEHSGCCINVWDLRTGNRLYSLVPRMPSDCSQSLLGKSTIRNHRTGVDLVSHPHQDPLEAASTRSRLDSSTLDVMTNGSVLAGTPVTLSEPDNPHRQLRFSGASSRPTTQSYFPPQLALLDIAVTPDHSTLIVTLCERSGEGREGVYCWDFTGSRLDGYHEHGSGMPTMVLDKTDISYDHADVDISTGTESKEYFLDEKRQGDRYSPNGILENKIKEDVNNDMIMQQVDPIALRELHLARVTGKVWIGWRQ